MDNSRKALNLLGLAEKAGKLASGEFQTETAVKKGRAYLAVIAEDASENTRKKFRSMCEYRNVPCIVRFRKEELGRAAGKDLRSSMAVLDEHLAAAFRKAAGREEE